MNQPFEQSMNYRLRITSRALANRIVSDFREAGMKVTIFQ